METSSELITIKGNPWATSKTPGFILIALVFLFFAAYSGNSWEAFFYITIIVFFLIVFGQYMYYYKVSDTNLIIYNHFFPWYRHTYRFSEIKEVTFKQVFYRGVSKGIRITCGGAPSKFFISDSLKEKDWDKLLKVFTSHSIPVKDRHLS